MFRQDSGKKLPRQIPIYQAFGLHVRLKMKGTYLCLPNIILANMSGKKRPNYSKKLQSPVRDQGKGFSRFEVISLIRKLQEAIAVQEVGQVAGAFAGNRPSQEIAARTGISLDLEEIGEFGLERKILIQGGKKANLIVLATNL